MKNLNEYTTKELEEELKKRRSLKRPKPRKYDQIEWSAIVDYLEDEGFSRLDSGEFVDIADFKQYLFENVMDLIYGGKVWEWWNVKIKENK